MGKPQRLSAIQALIDTSILVDMWRGNPKVLNWLQTQSAIVFGIPVLARMEIIDGARNRADVQQAITMMRPYPIVHLTVNDSQWALDQHMSFKLSHNVGIGDALIASAGARLGVPIYTLNTKHFTPLPGVSSIRPY